jgi:hypothetical protein
MFQAQTNTQYIPSKSIAIKPEVTSAVGPNEEVRIHIPSFVGMLDPNLTMFKADIQFQHVRGVLCPDSRAGGFHAAIRQLVVRDGNNSTTLELCEDYNAFKALMQNFVSSPSVMHKNELFEGVQDTVGDKFGDKTLFYAAHSPAAVATDVAPDTSKRRAHKVMVQGQLNAGIFKQGNIIPVSAMNGMRLTIQTDDILRSCVQPSPFGSKTDIRTNKIKLTTNAKTQGSELRTNGDAPANNGSSANGYIALTDVDWDNNPFSVGDVLYISVDDVGHTEEEALGNVLGFYRSGDKLGINYLPLRDFGVGLAHNHAVDSLIYYKVADREVAQSFYTIADEGTNVKSGSVAAPTFQMSEIEMICQSVQPPPAYVEGLLRAAASPSGISFDMMSYELHRHNVVSSGLVQAVIPTLQKRAKALFTQPLRTSAAAARSIASHSLTGVTDGARTYEYIHGTSHMPSRLAPLHRYSQVVTAGTGLRRAEALHMSELQKSIVNVGERVLSLQKIAENFCVSRSLSKYGQVKDLSEDTLSVRIDYSGAEHKILNNYVVGLRRVTISGDGIMASF